MIKDKKCKDCKEVFQPIIAIQPRCVPCAIIKGRDDTKKKHEQSRKKHEKAERKSIRKRKEALKSRGDYIKEAQASFNKFIRARDSELPCISCGCFTSDRLGGGWDAGHYRSRGSAPELRFEELNCHKQCKKCNQYLSGNVTEYRKGLLAKIGLEKIEWLEGPHELKKPTINELKDIKKKYNAASRAINQNGLLACQGA